jgi:hypothetical protein
MSRAILAREICASDRSEINLAANAQIGVVNLDTICFVVTTGNSANMGWSGVAKFEIPQRVSESKLLGEVKWR